MAQTVRNLPAMQTRRSPAEGNGYSLQYSCLENSMHRGAWRATAHMLSKRWTRLNDSHFYLHSVFSAMSVMQSLHNYTKEFSVDWIHED